MKGAPGGEGLETSGSTQAHLMHNLEHVFVRKVV